MSKAWELLKNLEEGGQLIQEYTCESRSDTYKMEGGTLLYQSCTGAWRAVTTGFKDLHSFPENYKIVVYKRKTVVEAWADFGEVSSTGLGGRLGINRITFNPDYADDYEAKVRVTVEEL